MKAQNLIDKEHLHLKIVHEISDLINKSSGLDNILDSVVNKISDSLNFKVVSIYIWNEKRKELVLRSTKGLKIGKNQIVLKPDEGLTGLVYKNMRPLIVTPASSHANYKYFPETGEAQYESYLGIPIILHNKCLGVLVGQTIESRHINPAEETLFQIIGARLAGLLEVADKLQRLKTPSILSHETKTYQGKGISSGLAIGNAFLMKGLFQQIRNEDTFKRYSINEEEKRLSDSFKKVEKELHELINRLSKHNILSENEIDIFHSHLMILNSKSLRNTIHEELKRNTITAEQAVVNGIELVASQFDNLEDKYIREKAQDFRDIGERLLHSLLGSKSKKHVPPVNVDRRSVIVTDEIGLSFVSMLSNNQVEGIIAEKGGETSHASIIAKSLGIPLVTGIERISELVNSGDKLIVDGTTGFVFVNPDNTLINEYKNTNKRIVSLKEKIEKEGRTKKDNRLNVSITANIGLPIDVEFAKQYGIEDIGLFRTEFAFMQLEQWPGVEEQVKIYKQMSKQFKGSVNIRTLDIGADKILPYFNIPDEENPLLGLRAMRFSMEYIDLFKEQVKAILLSVKEGCRFRILLPMISYVWEVETAKQIIEDTATEIGIEKNNIPSLGLMMEVPATIYQLEDYKEIIDFISVGTNDLIQYLIAVDRNSNAVGHLYSSFHPSVLRMLDDINKKAQSINKEISVCGEMAGLPSGALMLLSMGYRNISVSPERVPVVRYLANKFDNELLDKVRGEILTQRKEAEIRRYIYEVIHDIDSSLIELE